MSVTISTLSGPEVADALPALARLRIAVFRAFPYLYDGDMAHEQAYLAAFTAAPGAVLVIAEAEGAIVGAATASPLAAQEEAIRAPAVQAGLSTERIFYFGESVLDPSWRRRGVGHRFFDHREAAARRWGADHALFCAVVRPDDHAQRPGDYRPLDDFWRGRGYAPADGMIGMLDWREPGAKKEAAHPMQYWMRGL